MVVKVLPVPLEKQGRTVPLVLKALLVLPVLRVHVDQRDQMGPRDLPARKGPQGIPVNKVHLVRLVLQEQLVLLVRKALKGDTVVLAHRVLKDLPDFMVVEDTLVRLVRREILDLQVSPEQQEKKERMVSLVALAHSGPLVLKVLLVKLVRKVIRDTMVPLVRQALKVLVDHKVQLDLLGSTDLLVLSEVLVLQVLKVLKALRALWDLWVIRVILVHRVLVGPKGPRVLKERMEKMAFLDLPVLQA
jgi:hypothetical protein